MYVSNTEIVKAFEHNYLQLYFSKCIIDYCHVERALFQAQSDGSMIIVLHCSYTNTSLFVHYEAIIENMLAIFFKYKKILDLFLHAQLIDLMDWRASQPINYFLPKELQCSANSNIGFCGDWFDFGDCGRVESAMNSAIRLSKLLR